MPPNSNKCYGPRTCRYCEPGKTSRKTGHGDRNECADKEMLQDLLCEQVAAGLKGIQILWTGQSTGEKQRLSVKMKDIKGLMNVILEPKDVFPMPEQAVGKLPDRCIAVAEARELHVKERPET